MSGSPDSLIGVGLGPDLVPAASGSPSHVPTDRPTDPAMRVLFLLLLVLAAVGALWLASTRTAPDPAAADGPVPTRLSRAPAAGERVLQFEVSGMCCEGCTATLHESVSAVEGVRAAAIDFVAGTATVLCSEDADPEPMVAALSIDKYEARARL